MRRNKTNKNREKSINKNYDWSAVKIVSIYAFFSILWILTSDMVMHAIFTDGNIMNTVSILKGWFYVLITSILIFSLISKMIRRIKKEEYMLIESYKELALSNEKLAKSQKEVHTQYDVLLQYKEKLYDLAYQDHLTLLPNRTLFYHELSIKTLSILENSNIALFLVDIDNFKYINDIYGHDFGDKTLVQIATKLRELMSDKMNIYRIDGDEFAIIVENTSLYEAEQLATRINNQIRNLNIFDNMHVTMSIGIALETNNNCDFHEIIKYADVALSKAKISGRNSYRFFEETLKQNLDERVFLESKLKNALKNNEFKLYYQPQIDIKNRTIRGFEALIRWDSPSLGFLTPNRFIYIAEETKLIVEIGEWVIRQAIEFAISLNSRYGTNFIISVNVSPIQWIHSDFVDMLDQVLAQYQFTPELLELEITESILINSFDLAIQNLLDLRKKGINVALDDFGTGYSSLNYLKQLPISTLKIDKTFIDGIFEDKSNQTILNMIIKLGHTVGLDVIAEGVESEEQFEYLFKNNCDAIQGYIFSKPVPESKVIEFIEGFSTSNASYNKKRLGN